MHLDSAPTPTPYVAGLELSIDWHQFSLRAGRIDLFFRRRARYDPRWSFLREPNDIELFAFGLALTISWGPYVSGAAQ